MKLLSFTVAFAVMVVLFGRAIDHEIARAGANQGHNSVSVMSAARADSALSERVDMRGRALAPVHGGWIRSPARSESVPPPVQLEQPGYRWQGRTAAWWAKRAVQARKDANKRGRTIRRLKQELANREIGPTLAIRLVFGNYAGQALRVAWCESRYDLGATNGQYLGLFQMGSAPRSRYGHSYTALGQAQAAYRYFVDSGRDWSPWACRP